MDATSTQKDVSPSKVFRLPESYCPMCANERPEAFRFIREAEVDGAIVFTGHCARHLIVFLNSQPGLQNARLGEDGKVRVEFGASPNRLGVSSDVLPDSGMKWRAA